MGALSVRRTWLEHALPIVALAGLTLALTFPLVVNVTTVLPDSDDAYFSAWRLGWTAHALQSSAPWLDTNVFYPAQRTLLLSDAMPLIGLMGVPLAVTGASVITVHNLLLITSFFASALAGYWLALRVGLDRVPSLVCAVVVGFAPYRFAHFGHLELAWACWMPLSLISAHAILTGDRRRRWPLLLAASVVCQVHCSVYYGVFLNLIVWAGLALALAFRLARRSALIAIVGTLVVAAMLSAPYLSLYSSQRQAVGNRSMDEIAKYSATAADYLKAPSGSLLHGARTADESVRDERTLYPGVVALCLACIGAGGARRSAWIRVLLVLGLIATDLSLGVNGWLFRPLTTIVPPFLGLRAWARCAAVGLVFLALLAGLGTRTLLRALGGGPRRQALAGIAVLLLLVLDYWGVPKTRTPPMLSESEASVLRALPDTAVLFHWPVPKPETLWGYESTYQLQSTAHWRRMVNGYSGFAPLTYIELLWHVREFPNREALRTLHDAHVTHVVVHEEYLPAGVSLPDLRFRLIEALHVDPAELSDSTHGRKTLLFELR